MARGVGEPLLDPGFPTGDRTVRVEETLRDEVVTMPTYDYVCHACGHEFQLVQRISEHEKSEARCPECKSAEVERVLTGVFVKTGKKS